MSPSPQSIPAPVPQVAAAAVAAGVGGLGIHKAAVGGLVVPEKAGPGGKRFAAAGVAGIMELCLFHPLDTVAKRLMNSTESTGLARVVFKDATGLDRVRVLFPGFGFAAAYKVSQRVYKFGTQPIVKDAIQQRLPHLSRFWTDGLAGSVVGIGEVFLLPLDALKIKSQTNPDFFKNSNNTWELVRKEGTGLYRGWNWTMARNAPGSFALFGVNSYVKDKLLKGEQRKAAFVETLIASACGGVASVALVSPLDVIKTRLQSGSYGDLSGRQVVQQCLVEEGFGGLWKGIVPKVGAVAPKLIFSFTIAQWLCDRLA